MLQPELTTKKSTGEKKARLVVNGKQESVKEGENNYSPTSLSKSLHILFAVAAHEGRLIKGIDITCAFGSEFLTEEDGDIFVEYPEILEKNIVLFPHPGGVKNIRCKVRKDDILLLCWHIR